MIKKIFISVLLLLSLSFISLSSAQAAWSDPKKISTSANTNIMPSITTDALGYLHAVWMELTPGDEDFWSGNQNPGIFYSKWNGDTWSAPLKISNSSGWVGEPAIAADSLNRLHVVWDDAPNRNDGQIIYSMYNGSWSTPVTISSATNGAGKQNWGARISIDSSDTVHVIYNYYDAASPALGNQYYYTSKTGAVWSSPVLISDDCVDCQQSSLAAGPGSTITAALWGGYPAGNGIWIKRNTGSGWNNPPIKVSGTDQEAQYPKIIVDGTGKLHLVWAAILYDPGTDIWSYKVRYASSVDGTSWSAAISLNSSDMQWTYWGTPLLGLTKDSKNNVYAGWGEPNAVSGIDIKYRKWNGSTWASPVTIRNVTEVDSPYLFQDKWDNQHFVWTEKNQGTGIWEIWYSILPGYWATIGSGGGSLTVNPDNITLVTLTIPSGALASTTNISAAIGPLPQSANPNYVTVPRSYYFGPSGQTFSKNVTNVYTYTTAELNGGDPRSLGVYVWNGQTNSWNYVTGTVNTNAKTLTAKTDHFSLFGMMTPRVITKFLEPLNKGVFNKNSVVPVRFTMNYITDNSPVLPPDIELALTDNNNVLRVYKLGEDSQSLRFNQNTNQYSAQLHLKELGIAPGNYQLTARIAEVEVGSATLIVK